jgi:hypothetical protein
VDRLLAAGSLSVRSIAARFGLAKSSLLRHQKSHVMKVIERQIQRRRQREEEVLAESWHARLKDTYQRARQGADRAAADSEKWTAASDFLRVMVKTAEVGLRITGELQPVRPAAITIETILVLPQASLTSVSAPDTIEVKAPLAPNGAGDVR